MLRTWLIGIIVGLALASGGCGPEKLDTSKGSYGKVSNDTALPPQPDPQAMARERAANPTAGRAPAAPPAK